MYGLAEEDGSRSSDPILRVPPAGCAGRARMVPARGAAAGEGSDGIDRGTNRSGDRARTGAYPAARLFCESFPDRHRNASVLSPGDLVGEPARSRGTRELLRRRSDCDLRRRGELRAGADEDGGMADGSGVDDGGKPQPTRGERGEATGMGLNRWEDARGRYGREPYLPSASAVGGERVPGSGTRGVEKPRARRCETGASERQRD